MYYFWYLENSSTYLVDNQNLRGMKKTDIRRLFFLATLMAIFSTQIQGQSIYDNNFQWKIPGGKYIDPVSFFSLHGYVNAVFATGSPEWTNGNFNGIGMPGQVIIPNTNVPSFNNDEAIWISSELRDNTTVMMEIHLVNDPSGFGAAGPGGLTLVLTEANIRQRIYKNYLSVAAGTFWSVFGIQNQDWLGAQNLFSTIPLASGAYITHYNEKGIRLDGFAGKDKWGINYVMSIGNGFNAYDISGYTSFDLNQNKMFNGRVSFYPGLGDDLNIGMSYSNGQLFTQDVMADTTTKNYYNSRFEALGADITLSVNNFNFRSYIIASTETLSNDSRNIELPALGWMGELSYDIDVNQNTPIDAIIPKIRFDYLEKDQFSATNTDVFQTVSFGINFKIMDNFIFSVDYNIINENNNEIDNDRFIMRASANF